ncbi:hypothetical protein MF271_20645 (plasmid) [Deinococcus sp. KNUC1210]|uniref:hypothetical protein n=1 Tax=Deinococcus sp. KNUC1210 TaxID=2917691 RepID=UPI001EF0A939|nr:hypothetical protein [Deinococcus sp. KNUC1210]ULH17468.1 hypothetical protein MF271_20645 [Deinococcus sp. KNUC1210]
MRTLKNIVLLSVLALSGSVFAASSTAVDYDNATLAITATGTTAQNVSFTVPSTALTISSAYMRPSASYTVAVPVTNTTDRKITVSAAPTVSGSGTSLVTVSGGTDLTDLAAGATGTFTYTVTTSASASAEDFAGKSVIITFDISATSTSTN